MDAKTIIAIVLVAFIGGGALWLNIRHRKNKYSTFTGTGAAENAAPYPYMEVRYAQSENH